MVAFGTMVLACARRETPLEHAAHSLHAGLTKTNVDLIFEHFETQNELSVSWGQLDVGEVKLFQRGVDHGVRASYQPRVSGSLVQPVEMCIVYFDTNWVIVGYKYMQD